MDKLRPWVFKHKLILSPILNLSHQKNKKVYIVGGALRDVFLKRERLNPDIDFAVNKGAVNFARELSRKMRCGFVILDKERGCARLVKKVNGLVYTLDFTDFRGSNLEEDLQLRDFSVNSLAIELSEALSEVYPQQSIFDPCLGLEDIKKGLVRMNNRGSFDEDPLRIMRAFSVASISGFKIDKKTLKLACLKKRLLLKVSGERIRDELFKILSGSQAWEFIVQLDKYQIAELIFPEIKPMRKLEQGPYHHLDVWGHTLQALKNLELIIKNCNRNPLLRDYLNAEISSGRQRFALLKLAAILHDVGKPKTLRFDKGKLKFYGHETVGSYMVREITQRLKLSNEEIRLLRQITFCHLRPGYLADSKAMTSRAKFRYFRDTAQEAVSILLVSLADQRATRGSLTTEESRQRHEKLVSKLIKEYFKQQKEQKIPRLVNGHDLIKVFKLEPSVMIGEVLRELEELQAIGKIKNKTGCLAAAARIIKFKQQKRRLN